MATVKVLIAASDFNLCSKGDVVEVVSAEQDWGSATVLPKWIRLTITNVPGSQVNAENNLREYIRDWKKGFEYSKITGASTGVQRYRVTVVPNLLANFDLETKKDLRDKIISEFNGSLVNQSQTSFEFDGEPELEIEEIGNVISLESFRRFRFSDTMINQAIAASQPGDSVEFERTFSWVKANVIDKLRT
jgi:hypothetical protein